MKNYLSFKELDEIGESVIANYLGAKSSIINRIDIEGFAKSLGLKIVNVCFAESDMGKAGFIADGISPLRVNINGKVIRKKYPEKTLVIDTYLQRKGEEHRRRFLIAHEMHVVAATNDIDQSTLSQLRGMCVQEVKSSIGAVNFDDAVRTQKG